MKSTSSHTNYLAIDDNGLIYGIGTSAADALEDARDEGAESVDSLRCYPCSLWAAEQVRTQGGRLGWTLIDGVIVLDREPREEVADAE